jgi:hypothetical protein
LSASWRALSREAGLKYEGQIITVPCADDRRQQVIVDDGEPGVLRLWSKVAVRSRLPEDREELQRPEVEAWLINRHRELVGFKVAERRTIIGEAWVPTIDLTASEWALYVTTVAHACDRLEFLWTGTDRE